MLATLFHFNLNLNFKMVNRNKILAIHERGWDEKNDTYTTWGNLVLGYYSTSKELRLKYLKFLKKKKITYDIEEHISAIVQAMDFSVNAEEYGGYVDVFVGKVNVYDVKEYNYSSRSKG